jgi:hypothetical protein
MKTLFLILTALTLASQSKCQDTTSTSTIIFTLAPNSKKLTKDEYNSLAKNNYKHTTDYTLNDRAVKKNDILLIIRERNNENKKNQSLEALKSQLEYVFKMDPTLSVTFNILTFNDIRYLISETKKDNEYTISIYPEVKGNKSVYGLMYFKEKDKSEAHQFLDSLLQKSNLKK